MESDADSGPTYVPIGGARIVQTHEELAEVLGGFPERIVELRLRRSARSLGPAEQDELRLMEDVLTRSAPDLLPQD
jgi:hypothetical protein